MNLQTITSDESFKLMAQLLNGFGIPQAKPKAVRNFTMATLMLDAGLRVGEVTQLQVTDLLINDMPVKSLYIRAEITKSKRAREIPTTSRIQNAIEQMMTTVWRLDLKLPVFFAFYLQKSQQALSVRQIERIIKASSLMSIGRPIHPHVLRHTFASKLMRQTNIRVVQELLGHRNLSSTQIYTHPNHEDLTKAIESLNT